MAGAFDPRKIRKYYLNPGTRVGLLESLSEGIRTRQIPYNEVSIPDLFESLIEHGPELRREMSYDKSGGKSIRELMEAGAGMAVRTGDFANITGQIVYNRIRDSYTFPDSIGDQLCETQSTQFLRGERVPGIGGIGASAIEVVGEGESFPFLGVNEEWTDTVALQKRGFIVAITREMIMMDRTGLLLKRCADGGEYMGINKEFRVLSAVTGQTGFNSYNRNGVSFNTYNASGAFINYAASNNLVDWTSVEVGELLFNGITDPNTGLPIILPAKVMVVPNSLLRTANRIVGATQVATVDNTASANTLRQYYDNPLNKGFYGQPAYRVLANAYVGAVTGSTTGWYFGDYKKVVVYYEAWKSETTQAIDNNEAMFNRDIWQQHKVSECGNPMVMEPRFASKHGA